VLTIIIIFSCSTQTTTSTNSSLSTATSAVDSSSGPNELWGSIATGAFSLWKQAADATSDILVQMTAEEKEEDFRFPRPPQQPQSQQQQQQQLPPTLSRPNDAFIREQRAPAVSAYSPQSQSGASYSQSQGASQSSSTTSTPQSARQVKAAAPVGDDFFATFGVK
jgi:hypothetical protein